MNDVRLDLRGDAGNGAARLLDLLPSLGGPIERKTCQDELCAGGFGSCLLIDGRSGTKHRKRRLDAMPAQALRKIQGILSDPTDRVRRHQHMQACPVERNGCRNLPCFIERGRRHGCSRRDATQGRETLS